MPARILAYCENRMRPDSYMVLKQSTEQILKNTDFIWEITILKCNIDASTEEEKYLKQDPNISAFVFYSCFYFTQHVKEAYIK